MKALFIVCFLLFMGNLRAQIVQIPDPALKAHLVGLYDTNGDQEIQVTEAAFVQNLIVADIAATDLTGLQAFQNITLLTIGNLPQLQSITISNFPLLFELSIYQMNSLQTIQFGTLGSLRNLFYTDLPAINAIGDLSVLTGLQRFFVRNCNFQQVEFPALSTLWDVNFDNVALTSLDLTRLPGLRSLNLELNHYGVGISEINASGTGLMSLQLGGASNLIIQKINLANCRGLGEFSIWGSHPSVNQVIDLSGCDSLVRFNLFSYDYPDSIILSNCIRLREVMLGAGNSTDVVDIDFSRCLSLETVNIENGFGGGGIAFRELNFNTCPNLRNFYWHRGTTSSNSNINFKNGGLLNTLRIFSDSPTDTLNICADEFEVDSIRIKLQHQSNSNLLTFLNPAFPGRLANISPYCNFFPGGNHNTITGTVRWDQDNNGCDPNDPGLPNVPTSLFNQSNGQSIAINTLNSGAYYHYPYAGNFTLSVNFPNNYFNVTPVQVPVSFDTANNLLQQTDFCVVANGVKNDLDVTVFSSVARPGFDATVYVLYRNKGNTVLSGSVSLNFDHTRLTYLNSTQPPSGFTTNQRTWTFSALPPFQQRMIQVDFNVIPPPVNNIDDTLHYSAVVDPVTGDETPLDNQFSLAQPIQGAFDPNDKLCLQGEKINISQVGEFLHYTIRFQNMGNDTAFNVVIADTLDVKLDANSFDFIGSSHACAVKRKGNQLEFAFAGIKLPWAAINEEGSHGFVIYRIKPAIPVMIGDTLRNKASIYFDYNLPIVTNEVKTVVTSMGPVPVKLAYFRGTRKEGMHHLDWKAACSGPGTYHFEIQRSLEPAMFSTIGSIMSTELRCQSPFTWVDEKPLPGINYYRLRMQDENRSVTYSPVLQLKNPVKETTIQLAVVVGKVLQVQVESLENGPFFVQLLAADGRVVFTETRSLNAGLTPWRIPLQNLSKGIYVLVVQTRKGKRLTSRFVY